MNVEINDLPLVSKKNKMYSARGRVFKQQVVKDFERDLFDAIQEQWRGDMIEGDVALTIDITVPDKRRRDLQNFCDTICDVLNGLAYKDDSQITSLQMTKSYGKKWCLKIIAQPHKTTQNPTGLNQLLFPHKNDIT
jgi:Holliday junction resolvase RusA-like endonuclease